MAVLKRERLIALRSRMEQGRYENSHVHLGVWVSDLLDTIEDKDRTIKYLNDAIESLKREINILRKEE